jgi:glycosyltransferase involved in cell wall biosynthesis
LISKRIGVYSSETKKSERTQVSDYSVLLVCDFKVGLASRILDVYRFFKEPTRIILVRRGKKIPTDPRLSVRTQQVPLPRVSYQDHLVSACFSAALYLLYSFVSYYKIRREGSNVRLVHAHYIFPQGLFGLLLAHFLRVPLIVTAAGSDVNLQMRKSALLRTVSRFITKHADVTIAVSRPLQRELCRFGVTNTIYLPNSVDTSSIRPITSSSQLGAKRTILFVGNLIADKRPILLIRAFERVLEKVPEAILIMVGDGPLENAVCEHVSQRGLAPKVRFFSRVPPQSVIQMLVLSSVFVLPSLHEGLSLALLEAMASGTVIVASANESHRAILRNGIDALLFRPDNEEELAEQLVCAMTDDQLRLRLSRSARQLCLREFSNTAIGERLHEIYLKTMLRKSDCGPKTPRCEHSQVRQLFSRQPIDGSCPKNGGNSS